MADFNPFSIARAKPSLLSYIHNKISGYSKGRPLDVIHASDVTKPDFCARRRALQCLEHDSPKDEFLTTCQAKVFDEGRMYEAQLREVWAGDLAVGDWLCGWCGGEHQLMRKPTSCYHCHRPAPMIYREVRFTSRVTGVSCGVDTMLLLPGQQQLTMVEVKTIASHSTQKGTPTFGALIGALAEHHARSSWYLRLIAESGSPLAEYIDTTKALIFYISKGYGETTPELGALGILDKQTPFKEYWVDRDDELSRAYDEKALPLGTFMRTGVIPERICQGPDDPKAKKCPKVSSCFTNVYPPGQVFQRWRV